MFNVTASWHIHETNSSYNDWETNQYQTYGDALHAMLQVFGDPNHGCDDEWTDPDTGELEWFCSSVNYHRGVFLTHEDSTNWNGDSQTNVVYKPVPKCRPAVVRP